jgi:hypothetical protein
MLQGLQPARTPYPVSIAWLQSLSKKSQAVSRKIVSSPSAAKKETSLSIEVTELPKNKRFLNQLIYANESQH